MYIQIIANPSIIEAFQKSEFFEKVDVIEDIENLGGDLILLSEEKVEPDQLYTIRERLKPSRIFYLIKDGSFTHVKRMKMIADGVGIDLLLPFFSPNEIVDYVVKSLFQAQQEGICPVISFLGASPGVGVTSTILSFANAIADVSEVKVGVLGMNVFNPGLTFFDVYLGEHIDEMKARLTNHLFQTEDLIKSMHQTKVGFYYLAGNRNIKMQYYYQPHEADYLIDVARRNFDIVLIDAGSYVNSAFTVQALAQADITYLIVDQKPSTIEQFRRTRKEVRIEPDFIIINRYKKIDELFSAKEVEAEIGMPLLMTLPDVERYGYSAEMQKKFIYSFQLNEYNSPIQMAARGLLSRYNMPLKANIQNQKTKKKKFTWMPGVTG